MVHNKKKWNEYYAENKEEILKYNKDYYHKNKEKIISRVLSDYYLKRDQKLEQYKQYYETRKATKKKEPLEFKIENNIKVSFD